jgi:hypothetical protein
MLVYRYDKVRSSRSGNPVDVRFARAAISGVAIQPGTVRNDEHDVGSDVVRLGRTTTVRRNRIPFVHICKANLINMNGAVGDGILEEGKECPVRADRLMLGRGR